MLTDQNFPETLPPEPPPVLRHKLAADLTTPQDPQLNFTVFINSIFVQKRTFINVKNVDKCLLYQYTFLKSIK